MADDDAPTVAVNGEGQAYSLAVFRETALVPGCGSFTAAGSDSDLLLIKRLP
jgi:hypothetical protein